MQVLFRFIWPRENHVVIACEENDAVHVVHNLHFLDHAQLSSGTTHETCDSRSELVGYDGVFFVRVARGEGDVCSECFVSHVDSLC